MLRECVMYLSVSLLPYQMSLVTNYIFKLMAVNLRESFSENRAQKTEKTKTSLGYDYLFQN